MRIVCEFGKPSVTFPKLTVDGVAVIRGCVPVPLKEIVRVGFEALLVIVMLPEALPVEVGAKVAVKVLVWPAVNVTGGVSPEMLNPVPDTVASEIVTLADPPFVSVKV